MTYHAAGGTGGVFMLMARFDLVSDGISDDGLWRRTLAFAVGPFTVRLITPHMHNV